MAKKALGRGLSSILGDVDEMYEKELGLDFNRVEEIEIKYIKANPFQPRKHFEPNALEELSNSIKEHGLIQPIILLKKTREEFILIAGERRLRACQMLGFSSIKAVVSDFDESKLRELALIENIQRQDLNPIELALSYKALLEEYQITHEELSNIIHKSRAQITNTLRLLSLDEKTQELIMQGKISQGHAKVVVGLDKEDEHTLVNTIIGQKLSVRESEKLVQSIKNKDKSKKNSPKDTEFELAMQSLRDNFKKLSIDCKISNKQLIIHLDDLNTIQKVKALLR